MGLFSKEMGPVFLNKSSQVEEFIEKLRKMLEEVPEGELKERIKDRIALEKSGIDGENSVIFYLKNSGMDMYIIHDLNLTAQIDFLVITKKRIYVVECKNWKGNIEVTSNGDFLITEEKNGWKQAKRFKSPTSQNEDHLRAVKAVMKSSINNVFHKNKFEKEFEYKYKSLVVFTNTKSIINTRYAKKADKEPVVHIDQMIRRIQEMDSEIKEAMSRKKMKELADFYLGKNNPDRQRYEKDYDKYLEELELLKAAAVAVGAEKAKAEEKPLKKVKTEEELERGLRKFRVEQSRKEGIKAYYVFKDEEMHALISNRPGNKKELYLIPGFGEKRIQKYGEEILRIIND